MDGDGEDRPSELESLIKEALKNPECSVVAKRVKRSEGPIFTFFYSLHKLITLIFTGKLMNFGHYSLITKNDAKSKKKPEKPFNMSIQECEVSPDLKKESAGLNSHHHHTNSPKHYLEPKF